LFIYLNEINNSGYGCPGRELEQLVLLKFSFLIKKWLKNNAYRCKDWGCYT